MSYPYGQPGAPGYPPDQGGYPPQPGYPPQQFPPPGGYPPQQGYPLQPGYPPQQGYPPQSGYPQPTGAAPMAFYTIVSRLHGLALDVERGGTAPGTRVVPWNKAGSDNQQWYDDPATGTIRTKINGFCLDIEGDGALRIMPFQPGDPNQQWERDLQSGFIRNRINRKRVLDIYNVDKTPGAKIGAWDENGGPNQLWNFEGPGAAASQPYGQPYGQQPGYPQQYPAQPGYPTTQPVVQRREFYILSTLSGKVLDVKGGNKAAGTQALMWSKNSPPSKNQLWYSDPQGFIRSALTDFAPDAASGQSIHLQPFNGGPNQQWVVEGEVIKNRSNGEVFDVVRGNKDNGAEICSYKSHNGPNQKWRIEYV